MTGRRSGESDAADGPQEIAVVWQDGEPRAGIF